MSDPDIESLIQASAAEDLDLLEPASRVTNREPRLNRPGFVILAWLLAMTVGLSINLNPPWEAFHAGTKSVEVRTSIAMYHLVHRIETYRQRTGHLPDYLDATWSESAGLDYRRTEDGYTVTGRLGELVLEFERGDDPESLLHFAGNSTANTVGLE